MREFMAASNYADFSRYAKGLQYHEALFRISRVLKGVFYWAPWNSVFRSGFAWSSGFQIDYPRLKCTDVARRT
jgi:hypothetical protein